MFTHRVIPLRDVRAVDAEGTDPAPTLSPTRGSDQLGRPLRALRISVTDRCNFRCGYCMPKSVFGRDHEYLPRAAVLSFEEIERVARAFVACGVHKIRLTGGEPLLRKNLPDLVARLASLQTPEGRPVTLAMTTNGSLLRQQAQALRQAGLQRLTVSLDALDDTVFRRMNDMGIAVSAVLDGLDAARQAGFGQTTEEAIKVNMVVQRGVNDHEIVPMARHFRGSGMVLRFIEYMDVGLTNGWRLDQVAPSREVIDRLAAHFPLVPLAPTAPGETARRWGYADAQGRHAPQWGEVGVIGSVTQPFCGDCSRARLSTDGKVFTCLFGATGHDLMPWVRSPNPARPAEGDEALVKVIDELWQERSDRYSERRSAATTAETPRAEMSYLGG